MTNREYNGWTNYETWLVKLWQDNDQGEQSYWQDLAEEIANEYEPDERVRRMADAMKDQYEERAGELANVQDFWADLLGGALSEVNWFEIAEHWIDDAVEALDFDPDPPQTHQEVE